MRKAIENGDFLSFMETATAQYERVVRRGGSPEERAALRAALSGRADDLRTPLRSRVGRLWAGDVVDRAYGPMLDDLLGQPDPDPGEVLRIAEGAKARTLLDWMAGYFAELPQQAAGRASAAESALTRFQEDEQSDLVYSEIRLTSELALGERADRLGAELQDAESIYAVAGGGFSGVAAPPQISRVAAALTDREMLVEYVIPHHRLHPSFSAAAIAVHAGGARVLPLPLDMLGEGQGFVGRMAVDGRAPIDSSPLGNAVVELRLAIQQGSDARCEPELRRLHDVLIEPLRRAGLDPVGFDQLILVPHRLLHPVPWAALTAADGHRLIEDCALAFAPSAAVWLALREAGTPTGASALALADPLLTYAGLPALPHAAEEAAQVADLLRAGGVSCDVRSAAFASETALREQSAGRGIVYLATHGQFPENDALDFHRVLLARTRHHSGIVTADMVRRLDLHSAWLVVLSVCDGGLTRFGPGDEPQGLVPAFFIAGARNVISTLWEIDDQAGRDLMVAAAPYLLSEGPARALQRAAAAAARSGNVAVRDWAGFVCAGSSALRG